VPAEHGLRNFAIVGWEQRGDPQKRQKRLQLSTSAHAGLAIIAGGVLRFYMRDKARDPQFIGETASITPPMGSTLRSSPGTPFDVKCVPWSTSARG